MVACYAPDANSLRPTKEALRRAHSTRHMVRSMLLSVPGEEAILTHPRAAGYTYPGVGALKLLGKLPRHTLDPKGEGDVSAEFVEKVTKWLVSRQTLMLHEGDQLPMADDEPPNPTPKFFPPTFHVQGAFPVSMADVVLPNPSIEVSSHDLQWAGFNGRCNKVADTCYSFWVGGTLGVSCCHAR